MICTYINAWEIDKYKSVSDPEINELFQEVRDKFSNEYLIKEYEFITKRLFRKPRKEILYSLYFITILPEVQVINFYVDGSGTSINGLVNKSIIMAMLYGMINGHRYATNNRLKPMHH